jgi:16S rRNA (cytosine967-C5)-methyltransferase
MDEKVAARIVRKYLKKGNMARCLRDILPAAGLSKKEREEIAELVHDVVRWKRLYEHIIDSRGLTPTAETYVKLAQEGAQADASSYAFEYRYSSSSYVAGILKDHAEWAEFLNETPPTTLCVNFNKTTRDEVMNLLREESLPSENALLPSALLTTSVSKYSTVVQQRFAHVQDETSQLVSFLATTLGDSIFDMCAGNGGKTLALASMTRNQKKLSAYELNASKRATLKRRCGEYDAHVIVEDRLSDKNYDLVLVDAPCSGLGAARRNPEVKYIEGVGDFPRTQVSLLQQAANNVKKGGNLFYAVCTVTPEETTQVIDAFLNAGDFTVSWFKKHPYEAVLLKNTYGAFTALPRGDLFFLSVLQKK